MNIPQFIQKNKWIILLNVLGLSLFTIMLINVLTDGYMLVLDKWIYTHMHTLRTPLLNEWITMLTNINGMINSYIFALCVITILAYKKVYADIWFYLGATLGSTGLFIAVKYMILRTRPVSDIIEVTGYSFPSGHTTMSTAMSIAFYVVFSKYIASNTLRILFLIACLIWPMMIGFSRIYLGVHWFSDVLGGFGLGIFWVTLFYMFYTCSRKKRNGY